MATAWTTIEHLASSTALSGQEVGDKEVDRAERAGGGEGICPLMIVCMCSIIVACP